MALENDSAYLREEFDEKSEQNIKGRTRHIAHILEDNERLFGSKPRKDAVWNLGTVIRGVKAVSRAGLKGTEKCAAWGPTTLEAPKRL